MLPCRQQWFDDRHGSVAVGRLLAHAALLERNRWLEFAVLAELATSSSEGSQPNEKKKKDCRQNRRTVSLVRMVFRERDEAAQERSSGAVRFDQPLGSRIGGECLGNTDAELATKQGY